MPRKGTNSPGAAQAAAPRIDANRELPPDVVDALHGAGLYRMLFPRTLGGLELSLPDYVQVIEEIAMQLKAEANLEGWVVRLRAKPAK